MKKFKDKRPPAKTSRGEPRPRRSYARDDAAAPRRSYSRADAAPPRRNDRRDEKAPPSRSYRREEAAPPRRSYRRDEAAPPRRTPPRNDYGDPYRRVERPAGERRGFTVTLDPDVARVFRGDASVNKALRLVLQLMHVVQGPPRTSERAQGFDGPRRPSYQGSQEARGFTRKPRFGDDDDLESPSTAADEESQSEPAEE